MSKRNIVKPTGLKGTEKLSRMKQLMGVTPINESINRSVIELTKNGPDGNIYAIVRENQEYYIKSCKNKENVISEDFKYIGGLQNKKSKSYPSYAKAIKHLNLKFISLNEAHSKSGNINTFKNDNVLDEHHAIATDKAFSETKPMDKNISKEYIVNKKGSKLSYDNKKGKEKDGFGDNVADKDAIDELEDVKLNETERLIDKFLVEALNEELSDDDTVLYDDQHLRTFVEKLVPKINDILIMSEKWVESSDPKIKEIAEKMEDLGEDTMAWFTAEDVDRRSMDFHVELEKRAGNFKAEVAEYLEGSEWMKGQDKYELEDYLANVMEVAWDIRQYAIKKVNILNNNPSTSDSYLKKLRENTTKETLTVGKLNNYITEMFDDDDSLSEAEYPDDFDYDDKYDYSHDDDYSGEADYDPESEHEYPDEEEIEADWMQSYQKDEFEGMGPLDESIVERLSGILKKKRLTEYTEPQSTGLFKEEENGYIDEETSYKIKLDAPSSEPDFDASDEEEDFSLDSLEDSDEGSDNDKPFDDDEPFDPGVEADEEEDPEKFIQQLAGKIGTSLRTYTKDNGEPDFDLEKYVINSVISATHTAEMDKSDQKDIIEKIKTSGDEGEDEDLGGDEFDEDLGGDDEDLGDDEDGDTEENLEEMFKMANVYESFQSKNLDKSKKSRIIVNKGKIEHLIKKHK
tara:strand:+ start:2398 stop:4455 length:2058 start_codon:yes stop_codon:yes gene_type:complete